jgi:hypothetical protein
LTDFELVPAIATAGTRQDFYLRSIHSEIRLLDGKFVKARAPLDQACILLSPSRRYVLWSFFLTETNNCADKNC